MNICTEFFVIPGLPVIPVPEPESEDNGRSQDSGTPDRCLRGNDISQDGLF